MGLLNIFAKRKDRLPPPLHLPAGTFTVNRLGMITSSTLPRSFPIQCAQEIAATVISTFKEARDSRLPLVELSVKYPGLKVAAQDLGGGAIIFLLPQTMGQS
jgi:hypothetical protein